jgi:osmotically-inducible protein OsmY
MGKVTQEEANAVKIFARTVYGVQGVVALFEITPNANYL